MRWTQRFRKIYAIEQKKNQAKWKEENDTWLRKKAAASQTFVIVVVGKLNKMSINVRL